MPCSTVSSLAISTSSSAYFTVWIICPPMLKSPSPSRASVTGEWPKDFTEVTMMALKKKTQTTKCSDHRTFSLISHTAKIIAKILRRRIERKIEDVLGEDQFGFRRGKGTRDAIGMMRIIAEWTLEMDEELSICFIDWHKAFDRVNWTELMQILKISGIDWRKED